MKKYLSLGLGVLMAISIATPAFASSDKPTQLIKGEAREKFLNGPVTNYERGSVAVQDALVGELFPPVGRLLNVNTVIDTFRGSKLTDKRVLLKRKQGLEGAEKRNHRENKRGNAESGGKNKSSLDGFNKYNVKDKINESVNKAIENNKSRMEKRNDRENRRSYKRSRYRR